MAASASGAVSAPDSQSLQADAFRRLYPEQFFQRFFQDGVRPDGRTLGGGRATSIGLQTISVADGSALVRVGNTTALAAVKLDLQRPSEEAADRGSVSYSVEVAPFSSADWRPGKAPELVSYVSERLTQIMAGGQSPPMDPKELCIAEGKACWAADVSVYILNSDGSVLDVVLLAVVSALSSTVLPMVMTTPEGEFRRCSHSSASASGSEAAATLPSRRIQLASTPLSLTCCTYGEHLLADATAEEEAIASSSVTVVLDERSTLHGVFKSGGTAPATPKLLTLCVESAKLRYKTVHQLLQQALAAQQAPEQ